jgi:hypothetical protein
VSALAVRSVEQSPEQPTAATSSEGDDLVSPLAQGRYGPWAHPAAAGVFQRLFVDALRLHRASISSSPKSRAVRLPLVTWRMTPAHQSPALDYWRDIAAPGLSSSRTAKYVVCSFNPADNSTALTWTPPIPSVGGHLSWEAALSRLHEFRLLPANWDSYDADPIAPVALATAHRLVDELTNAPGVAGSEELLPSNIAPIADGGIQFEWEKPGGDLEVELMTDGRLGYFLASGHGAARTRLSENEVQLPFVVELIRQFLNVPSVWRSYL